MIDSHCHLADHKFDADLKAVIERAVHAGVDRMIAIADSVPEAEKCVRIAEKFPEVFCTVGVHPHVAKEWRPEHVGLLKQMAGQSKKVVAIGEIGLDYHYSFSPRETQRQVFREQLTLAKSLELPVVVHCREAVEEVWEIVQEVAPKKLVMHCCTEKWEDVRRFVECGYFLSFTGIATFADAEEVRRTINECPLAQLMIETDAPYLAPLQHRGKRNEPAYVVDVARKVAEIKGMSLPEVDRATTQNTIEFFGLPQT